MIHGIDDTLSLPDLERHIARVEAILAKPATTRTARMQRGFREEQLRSLRKQAAKLRQEQTE